MAARPIVVWDLPVRLTHWLVAALVGISWYTAETGLMDWHRRSGYAVFGLLIFRLLWGFVGSSTARFSGFITGPGAVRDHLARLKLRQPAGVIGHNPLGALSVMALLAVLLVQTVTGLFAVDVDGIESGPLSDRVSFDQGRALAAVHHASFTVLQGLVVLHIAAILFYLLYKHENLLRPMITGKRRIPGTGLIPASPLRLLACGAVAGAAVWLVANGLRI